MRIGRGFPAKVFLTKRQDPSDVFAPTLLSFVIGSDGTTLTAAISESGCTTDSGGDEGTGGFTVAGTTSTIFSWAISGTTLIISFNASVYQGETITLSYSRASTTDDIKDAAGNYLANFSGSAVTNQSSQPDPSAGEDLTLVGRPIGRLIGRLVGIH
jgi:hypothetical protein